MASTRKAQPVRRKRSAPATVLVVAIGESVHTARWLNMVRGPDLRFVLLSVYEAHISELLQLWRPVRNADDVAALREDEVGVFDLSTVDETEAVRLNSSIEYSTWVPSFMPGAARFAQPLHLVEAIRRLHPKIVHSMEVQMAGYLCLATRCHLGRKFPFWLLSNWGSDIYLYRKLEEHRPRLLEIARTMDAYLSECRRDTAIVRQMGFRGTILPTIPASGGSDFAKLPALADLPPPSARREVLVKGYHGWSGRGLHILTALHLAAPALRGFRIRVTLASPEVAAQAEALVEATGLDVVCDDYLPSHREALDRVAGARMTIGLGISDGISTTLLESMALGSFPIQANTSCGCEWVEEGTTGFLLSPHDVAGLARAIGRAASDDHLVDAAATRNRAVVEERWDAGINGRAMVERYRELLGASGVRAASGPRHTAGRTDAAKATAAVASRR